MFLLAIIRLQIKPWSESNQHSLLCHPVLTVLCVFLMNMLFMAPKKQTKQTGTHFQTHMLKYTMVYIIAFSTCAFALPVSLVYFMILDISCNNFNRSLYLRLQKDQTNSFKSRKVIKSRPNNKEKIRKKYHSQDTLVSLRGGKKGDSLPRLVSSESSYSLPKKLLHFRLAFQIK